jgi:hypothetical protein
MRSAITFAAAVTLAMSTGCLLPEARPPKMAAVATGEPLAVVDDVKVWTTTSKEKTGESVVKDADGHTLGTVENYQDKTTVHSMKVWYPFQGNEQLSDEEFFKIANEQRALDETASMHATAEKWNHRGKITALVSGAALVTGFIIGYAAPDVPVAAPLLEIGGGLGLSVGYSMAWYGARQMQPENHAVDRSIAERAAVQYNQNLGHTAGISMSRSF